MYPFITDESSSFHRLFTFGKPDDVHRVTRGKRDLKLLDEHEQFGLAPHGRLLLDKEAGAPGISELAYSPFLWCGSGHMAYRDTPEQFKFPGHRPFIWGDTHVFNVTLHTYSEVYVADHAPYRKLREHFRRIMKGLSADLTDDQIHDMKRVRARTLTPLSTYDGSYEAPIFLVRRNLELSEVKVVSGPWYYKNGAYRLVRH